MKLNRIIIVLMIFVMIDVILPTPSAIHAQNGCSDSGTLEEFQLAFVNDTNQDITVSWVDYECNEAPAEVIVAGESLNLTSYDGHDFAFYNTAQEHMIMYGVSAQVSEVSLGRLIAEAGSLDTFAYVNDLRSEMGYEPIYFSGVLQEIGAEAMANVILLGEDAESGFSISDEGLLSDHGLAISEAFDEVIYGQEFEYGFAGNSYTFFAGDNAFWTMDSLSEYLLMDAEGSLEYAIEDPSTAIGWFDAEVQSYGVYVNENAIVIIYSRTSQPQLSVEADERAAMEMEEAS